MRAGVWPRWVFTVETLRLPALGAGNLIKRRGGAAEGHTCPCGSRSPHPTLLSCSPACAGGRKQRRGLDASRVLLQRRAEQKLRGSGRCVASYLLMPRKQLRWKRAFFFIIILCRTAGTEIKASLIAKEACNNKNWPIMVREVRMANVKQLRQRNTEWNAEDVLATSC